jgi:hypothetical protein
MDWIPLPAYSVLYYTMLVVHVIESIHHCLLTTSLFALDALLFIPTDESWIALLTLLRDMILLGKEQIGRAI